MVAHLQFAKERKKAIAFCESGGGVYSSYPQNGIADDGDFPRYLLSLLLPLISPLLPSLSSSYLCELKVHQTTSGKCRSDIVVH